jgi:hypothetical protein
MKITPDQLAALQSQQKKTSQSNRGEEFMRLLTQEMQSGDAAQGTTVFPATPQPGIGQILQTSMLHTSTERTIMDKMDALLTRWENYSQSLATPQHNLREGYRILDDIRSRIREVKEDATVMAAGGQSLERMIEELDILTVTEEFKFNRGDYMN